MAFHFWILLITSSYLSHAHAITTAEIKFEDTNEYAVATSIDAGGCAVGCATRASAAFEAGPSHVCDAADPFPCICNNATASSTLRDDIWDRCFNGCGYKLSYLATSILAGYCASNTKARVDPVITATATSTVIPGEIYFEDTNEYAQAMSSNGCAGNYAPAITRSFKLAHECDPVDSSPCLCGNATASSLLFASIAAAGNSGCGEPWAQQAASILPAYCSSNAARLLNASVTITTTTRPGGTAGPVTSRGGSAGNSSGVTETGTPSPLPPTSTGGNDGGKGGLSADGIAGVVVGTLTLVVAIILGVWQVKKGRGRARAEEVA
ncbi:hypothetical protein B0H63DRAFT_525926 [Podospora didyma]|uniref:Extracellular membrane protein CFEM domain-containing protein n=1 Tax=Podospora didyma TaxID=330526 RepID=A0AAE0KEQ6_9PEZI|nr:hypothetical protein B0H63DRAFT_525926 [Podospora didyma]